jgi:hypothetical protein
MITNGKAAKTTNVSGGNVIALPIATIMTVNQRQPLNKPAIYCPFTDTC